MMNLQLGSHDLPCRLLQVSVGRQGENAGRGPLSPLSSAASDQIVLKAYVCFCICVNRKHQILTDLVFSSGGATVSGLSLFPWEKGMELLIEVSR